VTTPHQPHGAAPKSDTTLLVIAKQPLPGRGAFAAVRGPALLIGMDTPQLTPGLLIVDWEVADATHQASGAVREQV
jgi:hypothetical protein